MVPYKGQQKKNYGIWEYAVKAGRYKCPKCKNPYTTAQELATHIKVMHNK